MRHPSKHRFFSRFLVPDRLYSDSAGATFWTTNRFTKTRTFQNFSRPPARPPLGPPARPFIHWYVDSSCSSCQGRRRVKTFFDANRAQLSQGKPVQAKPSRAESTGINRPALYTLTPDRPPEAEMRHCECRLETYFGCPSVLCLTLLFSTY